MQTDEGETLIAFWSPSHKLNFIVLKEELSHPMNLQNYYEVKREKVKERALKYNYAFISAEELTINGIPAIKDIFFYSTPNGLLVKDTVVYIVKDQTAWIIGFSGEPTSFDEFNSTFEAIISSFSLHD